MKPYGLYLLAVLGGVAAVGAVAWAVTDAPARQAVLVSAALAVAVQMAAFALARALQPRNLMLGWGLGSVLRLAALVLYAVVVARLWRAPITPALLSFVAFLFVTTAVEPLFLKR